MNKKMCLIGVLLVITIFFTACGIETTSDSQPAQQATGSTEEVGTAEKEEVEKADNKLGDYSLEILGCRLAKDYADKDIVIVKYAFTNNGDDAASFSFAFDDSVFQNGVGLNDCFMAADSANYSADDQRKEIQKGASLEVEVAYELNDTETKIDVEVSELISFSDKKITKSFDIK